MLVWILQRILRSNKTHRPRKVLVVSTTALGDTLWATPALQSLRTSWPDAEITILTSPIGEQTLRHNPWNLQILVLKEPMLHRFFSLWRRLKKERFQDVIIFHASQRLILPLCALLGATRIVGTVGINKGLDTLLTHPVPFSHSHEIVRRLELIEILGAKRSTEELSYFLQPHETIPRETTQWTIAIHPGSKDRFKRWPAEHFIEAGKELTKRGASILITGTAQEEPLLKQIHQAIPGAKLCNLHNNLRTFAAKLKNVDLLISNDTGPVHLACALKVPVIALYAPTDPRLCGPHRAKQAIAIAKSRTCTPCLKRKCREPFCLLQIGTEEVVERALTTKRYG